MGMRARKVCHQLYRARTRMVDHHGYDPARLYISRIWTERGPRVMSIHQQRAGYYFRKKKLQNMMQLVVREMPMNEYFHKVYIMKEVPRSVTLDMRMALRDGRAPRSYEREWAPYDGLLLLPLFVCDVPHFDICSNIVRTTRSTLPRYITAESRIWHRRGMQFEDHMRRFDYYQTRREWIDKYASSFHRDEQEAREARGLPPLAPTELY
ncbi:hypothetical protein Pmar_PMAR001519 [Perkinsus marinus ATCC 50983]|uniref:Uncharacterized protein n=1 Tax=Perkinsus marinus (strain ATCC 50983 / TXsc) TaxID=423536 RepID=C5LMZ5_PERM5|nr:hypothetical protein Pmar_PMAR001519 [Perkinsus marinus ATCC 50983]EER01898.1 hypothetical protein Pmar_PMAR001519 [Perkinsus marinus ATCC 50983]|eukprot:XP_002769180.1 hypothetical protein Pmar_PMAR001519 [Perkinsus marinus ATCC 50983]